MKPCPVCEGKKVTGKIAKGEDAETVTILGQRIPVVTMLDQPCNRCGGTGLVESWTPEPWAFSNRDWRGEEHPHHYYVTGCHGSGVCTAVALVVGNETSGDVPRDTARRLCAAVNACQGIPTAALESGVVADLLARLADAERLIVAYGDPFDGGDWQAVQDLRAVLAKAKGPTP